jgi:hypothetical protein
MTTTSTAASTVYTADTTKVENIRSISFMMIASAGTCTPLMMMLLIGIIAVVIIIIFIIFSYSRMSTKRYSDMCVW